MNTHEAIHGALKLSSMLLNTYLSDLTDEDILQRAVAGSNHPAWQIGHLIKSEHGIMEGIKKGASPELPEGFADRHSKEASKSDDSSQFESKNTYLELYKKQRAATIEILDSFSPDELSNPGPEPLRKIAPTIGSTILFLGMHELSHAGQWVILRRKLNKPVLI